LNRQNRILVSLVLLVYLAAVAGCGKKEQPLPMAETAPAAAAPTPAPTVRFAAAPTLVTAGDQVQLRWSTTDATTVSIDGIGTVPTAGVKSVNPTESTNYHLVAHGDGGTADATARVTVTPAAPRAVVVPTTTMSAEQTFKGSVQDIFYDYDTYDVRSDAQSTLSHDASYLASNPNVKIVIGGYCDERGSNEYNLALGQNRADAAKNALVTAGVAANRIRVVSYGKEKPYCTESTEECWQQNRRAGFTEDK
jgi:peptidoglycan-associated lipoprotein